MQCSLDREAFSPPLPATPDSHGIDVTGTTAALGKDHVIGRDRDDTDWALLFGDIAWVRAL